MTGLQLAVVLALCIALGAAAALVVLGAGRLGRGGDIMAIADATRECTACLGGWGPCTCAEPCGSIRCTAWDDAITPGQLRLVRDTKENTQ